MRHGTRITVSYFFRYLLEFKCFPDFISACKFAVFSGEIISKSGNAHRCRLCNRSVHLICGTPEKEEGYGQYVTCFTRLKANDGTQKRPLWN